MAFPFLFHENFEQGNLGAFSSEVDTLGKIDFPDHNDDLDVLPWRGGYVMRVDLDRGVTDAYLQQNTAFALSSGNSKYMRFFLRLSRNTRFAAGSFLDFFRIYSGPSGGSEVSEIALALVKTETWISVGIGSAEDITHIVGLEIIPDVWTQIRFKVTNSGSQSRVQVQIGNNMVQNMRLNMPQPLTHCRFGTLLQHPDIRGTLYFDDIVIDSDNIQDQMYLDPSNLAGESVLYIKTSYVFVGPGTIKGATLIGGGGVNEAYLYDVDRLPMAHHDMRAALKVTSAESKDVLIETITFKRGCYLVMKGTAPQVIVHFGEPQEALVAAA